MVSSNPRAPEGQSSWRISALAAYKARGFSPQLIFHLFSLRHTLCQFPSASFKLFQLTLSLPLSFLLSLLPLPPVLFFSHLLSLFFCPSLPFHPPLQSLALVPPLFLSLFMSCLIFFPHLIQCGLAHREVFDLQSILVGLQLVEDVSHPSWSDRYVVFHHSGVLVLCFEKECTSKGLNILKCALYTHLKVHYVTL